MVRGASHTHCPSRCASSSPALLLLEVLVDRLEMLIKKTGIIVPSDAAAEEIAGEVGLKQYELRLLASILRLAEGHVPTSERHPWHHPRMRILAQLGRLGCT